MVYHTACWWLAALLLPALTWAQAPAPVFAPAASYPTGAASSPLGLRIADINGDAWPDIVTANYGNNTIGVLLGSGSGTFQSIITFPVGGGSIFTGLAVADVNLDGKADVLVANYTNSTAGILFGLGTGAFQSIVTYPVGNLSGPADLKVADSNGDGWPDIVVANSYRNTVGILLGAGNGAFQPVVPIAAGNNPYAVAVADVNGDGRSDLLTANHYGASAGILLANGMGTFNPATTYSLGGSLGTTYEPVSLAVADVSGDSYLDLVLTCANNCTAAVLLGAGNGHFGAVSLYSVGTGNGSFGTELADLNRDGWLDVVVANANSNTIGVLLGVGNGAFRSVLAYSTGLASHPSNVVVADLNADGRPDIITANGSANTVSVLLNTTPLATRAALPGATATLAPNPARDHATLSLAGLPAAVARVQAILLDATGRVVAQYPLAAGQGTARAEVPTATLAAGLYVLRLEALDAQGQPAGSLLTQRLSIE